MKSTSKFKSSTVNASSPTKFGDPIIAAAMLQPLGVKRPGPHPRPVRLVVRRRKAGRAFIYVKRPGRQAFSTGIPAEHIDRIPELLAMATIQDEAERKGVVAAQDIEIEAVIAAWIEANMPHEQESNGVKKRYNDNLFKLSQIAQFMAGKKLGQITEKTCREYANWRTGRSSLDPGSDRPPCAKTCGSLATVHGDLKVLDEAIDAFKRSHQLFWRPTLWIPQKSGGRVVWLTRSDIARIVWAIRGRIWDHEGGGWLRRTDPTSGKWVHVLRTAAERKTRRILFRFLWIGIYTGTRHDALRKTRWTPDAEHGYFDVDNGVIHRAGHSADPAAGKPRYSSLVPEPLLRHLRRWKARDEKGNIDHVIHRTSGAPYRTHLRDLWNTVVADAGLGADVTPHVMRHTACTWLKLQGVNVYSAADMVGMHWKTLLRVYGQWTLEGSRDAAKSMGDRGKIVRISRAIVASGKTNSRKAPRPAKKLTATRTMTDAAKRKLSFAMKENWARRR